MTRLSKLLIVWLGVLLVMTACSSSESGLTAESTENAEEKEEVVMETAVSTSTAEPLTPTVQQPDSPTAQPTATLLPTPELVRADFPNLGIAPEIENEVWINADEPVTLASQRGKVVLVEFWTFG